MCEPSRDVLLHGVSPCQVNVGTEGHMRDTLASERRLENTA